MTKKGGGKAATNTRRTQPGAQWSRKFPGSRASIGKKKRLDQLSDSQLETLVEIADSRLEEEEREKEDERTEHIVETLLERLGSKPTSLATLLRQPEAPSSRARTRAGAAAMKPPGQARGGTPHKPSDEQTLELLARITQLETELADVHSQMGKKVDEAADDDTPLTAKQLKSILAAAKEKGQSAANTPNKGSQSTEDSLFAFAFSQEDTANVYTAKGTKALLAHIDAKLKATDKKMKLSLGLTTVAGEAVREIDRLAKVAANAHFKTSGEIEKLFALKTQWLPENGAKNPNTVLAALVRAITSRNIPLARGEIGVDSEGTPCAIG